jgi:hypothetical protein
MRTVFVAGSAFALGVLLSPWFHAGTPPPYHHHCRRAHLAEPTARNTALAADLIFAASASQIKPTTKGPTINDTLLHVMVDSVAKGVLSLSHLLVPSALFAVLCQRKVPRFYPPPNHPPTIPLPNLPDCQVTCLGLSAAKVPSNFA